MSRLRISHAFRRLRAALPMMWRARTVSTQRIDLSYQPDAWYRDRVPEMLRIADDAADRLSAFFKIPWPGRTPCYVTDPETAREILGVQAAACRCTVIIGISRDHMSEFGLIAVHELAHILSQEIGDYECMFKGEGFACFAAWALDPGNVPCGLPLHYHVAWLRHARLDLDLQELWDRKDYNSEVYDLGWSFAAFLVERFALKAYLAFYGAKAGSLEERARITLGVGLKELERDWRSMALDRVVFDPSDIRRGLRWEGAIRSRASWLASTIHPARSGIA